MLHFRRDNVDPSSAVSMPRAAISNFIVSRDLQFTYIDGPTPKGIKREKERERKPLRRLWINSLLTYIYQEKAEERFRKQEKEKWEKEKEIEKKRIIWHQSFLNAAPLKGIKDTKPSINLNRVTYYYSLRNDALKEQVSQP